MNSDDKKWACGYPNGYGKRAGADISDSTGYLSKIMLLFESFDSLGSLFNKMVRQYASQEAGEKTNSK